MKFFPVVKILNPLRYSLKILFTAVCQKISLHVYLATANVPTFDFRDGGNLQNLKVRSEKAFL